ncbi:peptidoglycan DD-metalloendopeptidase family protein [Oscillospiraceae bacterium OttesenSCG-928-G22]|nr:peptidoglycan DD-metalloendopeptidase family protein [Oscillospiraceae bacterium OttesenSCG-928-G22]
MKQSLQKKLIAAICIVMALLMILPLVLSAMPAAGAVTQSDINKLREEAKALKDEKTQLQSELKRLTADKTKAMQEKKLLDSEIAITEQQIANTTQIIQQLSESIAAKEVEIENAEADEAAEYELFKKRVRVMEENGNESYLSVLLQADSFSSLLSRLDVMNDIIEYDNNLMNTLREIREGIESAKAELEEAKGEQDQIKADLLSYQNDLEGQLKVQKDFINDLEANEAAYKKAYEDAEKAEKEAQAEINNMLAQLAKNTKYVGGEFAWPIPGYYTVTSPFGMRFHPVLKQNKLHTGTDIGAPKGTKIVAMNAGTVITAGFNTGYGNYVVIDHGGGYATLYAHMSVISVKKGQTVKREDQVGLVGSTGYSTGPHLHFEIIIDGVQKNPMDWFTK